MTKELNCPRHFSHVACSHISALFQITRISQTHDEEVKRDSGEASDKRPIERLLKSLTPDWKNLISCWRFQLSELF